MHLHQLSSPFLKNFLLDTFGFLPLNETKATCDDCLCSKKSRGALPYYHNDLKCCTFHPFLPNFAVGAILKNNHTPSSITKKILSKINLKQYALPLGIFAPLDYQIQFNNRNENDFGNKKDFLCPYFDSINNNCGIWEHRGSVCTSYFCISDRGEKGLKIWELIGDYLHLCEMILSQDALVSMGLPPEIIEYQLEYVNCTSGTSEEMSSSSMNSKLFEDFWTDWPEGLDSIPQYYISCANYISSLTLDQYKSLLFNDTQKLEEDIKKALV